MENNKTQVIYNLVKVLEQMADYLDFTVFYTWEDINRSHHFCPAWDFEGHYYEIQYDPWEELQVLAWRSNTRSDAHGDILSENEITQLTKDLAEFWALKELKRSAEKELKKEENIKQTIASDGWQHFKEGNIITSCFDEDVIYSVRTEKLTPDEIIGKYKGILSEKEIKNLKDYEN